MGMKRCPICGEKYSDTYQYCPFCEEEEVLKDGGRAPRRPKSRRASRRREPNLLSPVLFLILILLAGTFVYLLFGDSIARKLGFAGVSPSGSTSSSDISAQEPSLGGDTSSGGAAGSSSGSTSGGGVTMPSGEEGTQTEPSVPLSVNNEDFTLKAGETFAIKASGGSGDYTWESEDPGTASVDGSGRVTAIGAGTTTVTVSDGSTTVSSIVRVRGTSSGTTTSPSTLGVSNGDFTLSPGETYTIKASGGSGSYTWSSKNPAIVKVDANGKVTGVAAGNTTVTVSDGSSTASSIVRVK